MLTDNFVAVSVKAIFLAGGRMAESVPSLLQHKHCSEMRGHREPCSDTFYRGRVRLRSVALSLVSIYFSFSAP